MMTSSCNLPLPIHTTIVELIEKLCSTRNCKLDVTSAARNGDNFSCEVLRVNISVYGDAEVCDKNGNTDSKRVRQLHNQNVKLIVKIAPKNEIRRQQYSSSTSFSRENYTFTTILPEFEKFQLKFMKRNKIFLNYPNLIRANLQPSSEYIILSDMCTFGYHTSDRTIPFDFRHSALIMKHLGRFHAISFAMKRHNRQMFEKLTEKLTESIFTAPLNEYFEKFLQTKVDNALTTLTEPWDGRVRERLIEFRKSIGAQMVRCVDTRDDDAAVICHGDLWTSNIMFRMHDESRQENVCFLDWQVVRCATPVIDIAYFIFCCTDAKLRENLPKLLKIYHKSLTMHMKDLNCPADDFPMAKLNAHMNMYSRFGLGMALMTLHSTTCNAADLPNVDSTLDALDLTKLDTEIIPELIKKPAYRERISDVCRDIFRYGYLDSYHDT